MRIAIGCDHIVTDIKDRIVKYLVDKGHEVADEGTYDFERTHYPIYGRKVGMKVVNKEVDFGIVLCGTGVGISNSVSKVPGIRTALVRDVLTAKKSREKFDANVISFGGRIIGQGLIENIIDTFLNTNYIETEENNALIGKLNSLNIGNTEIKSDEIFCGIMEKWDEGFYHD